MEKSVTKPKYNFKRTCHYYGMFFFFILLITSFWSCEKEVHTKKYSLEFEAMNLNKVSAESWLEIDGVRLCHSYNFFSDKKCDDLTLPSFKFVEFEVDGKQQISYMNKIDFSVLVYEKFFKNNDNYIISNLNLIYSVGIIKFKRKDNKKVKIKFSNNYPIIL